MAEVKIVSVELVRIRSLFGKRYRVNLNQEVYLNNSNIAHDYIFVEAEDELEAYKKGMEWLKK